MGSDPLKRHIGYVIQEVGLFPHFTIGRNVGLVPTLEGKAEAGSGGSLLKLVGLPSAEYRDRYPRQLSGGQRQRAGVARALAAEPPLLLLDEPFGALDPVIRLDLQDQFLKLRTELGTTAIFVTHDIREAIRIGTRIILLANGKVDWIAPAGSFGGRRAGFRGIRRQGGGCLSGATSGDAARTSAYAATDINA